MEDFKVGDKVVFKKEVIDKISKAQIAQSLVGISLERDYYKFLTNNNSNFEKLGYFEIKGFGYNNNNLDIGIFLGKDLFEHYQEECSYKTGDELNKKLDSKKESDSITTKKDQNNEIRFQRKKASCKRGVVPAGRTISGRKDKIAISIGHLSYRVCNY